MNKMLVENAVYRHWLKYQHIVLPLLIISCAYLAYIGFFSWLVHWLLISHVNNVSQNYLHSASLARSELLGLLSASKTVLAILHSSQAGVNLIVDAQIQLGQSLNVIFELINHSWLVSVISLAAIEAWKLLLDLSYFSMAKILVVFFLCYGLHFALRRYKHTLPVSNALLKLSDSLLFIVLLVHFIFPVSVFVTATVGEHYFSSHKAALHSRYREIQSELPAYNMDSGLKDQVKQGVEHFKVSQKKLHLHITTLTHLTAQYTIYSLAEFILLPLMFVIVFSILTRILFRRLLL